jgi:hypothetical protein
MSNDTMVAVAENGKLIFPKNFDQLSHKRQKQIIVEAFRDNLIAINEAMDEMERLKESARRKAEFIRLSKEGKELARCKSELKRLAQLKNDLCAARAGMLLITKKLGFNVIEELKKMKLIETNEN